MLLKHVPETLYSSLPPVKHPGLSIRYLGTAGFVVQSADRTLVLDPYITRPGMWTTFFSRLHPNDALIEQIIPHADDVLVGHAHFDHVLDAPSICHRTGARLIGSPSVCNVGRAAGLPEEQLYPTTGRECIPSGAATLKGLPSLHGKVYMGYIPLQGPIQSPPQWPPRYRELRCGLVLNWSIQIAGWNIVHIDSADYIDEELEGTRADIVCLCAIGRKYRPNYVKTVVEKLRPRYIVPCHWDWFFTPFQSKPKCLPGVRLADFMDEIQKAGATPILLPFNGEWMLPKRTSC